MKPTTIGIPLPAVSKQELTALSDKIKDLLARLEQLSTKVNSVSNMASQAISGIQYAIRNTNNNSQMITALDSSICTQGANVRNLMKEMSYYHPVIPLLELRSDGIIRTGNDSALIRDVYYTVYPLFVTERSGAKRPIILKFINDASSNAVRWGLYNDVSTLTSVDAEDAEGYYVVPLQPLPSEDTVIEDDMYVLPRQ